MSGPPTVSIPERFRATTRAREGAAGSAWLDALPRLVADALERWDCRPDGIAWHGEVALVLPVQHVSGPAVLKLSFPHPGNRGEAAALRTYAGNGAVRLIEEDPDRFVLLLERARPQTLADHLATHPGFPTEAAIELAAELTRRLSVPPDGPVRSLADTTADWIVELDAQLAALPHVLPRDAVRRARHTIDRLAGDRTPTLLHGDLHDGNILAGRREPWLAIDPKGWTGTAAFDAFTVVTGRRDELRALDDAELRRAMGARITRFAVAAGVNPGLAAACCQARAVSSSLYQQLAAGNWFDRRLLRVMAEQG